MSDKLIPEGVELKDTDGKVIHEYRLAYMLGCEERAREQNRFEDLIREQAGTWGFVHEVYTIGEYAIAEVVDRKMKKVHFSCHINGKSINRSAETLDIAILECMCHKYDGINTRAPRYIAKMIGALPTEEV